MTLWQSLRRPYFSKLDIFVLRPEIVDWLVQAGIVFVAMMILAVAVAAIETWCVRGTDSSEME